MALRNLPYMKFYVTDFLTDEKLIECTAESTGVYIRLLCIMHKPNDYGAILLKQKDKQNASNIKNFANKLVKQMPYSVDVIERALTELIEEEVITLDGDTLYQKRMVKDGELSDIRASAGTKGILLKQNAKQTLSKSGAKPLANSQAKVKQKCDSISDSDSNSNSNSYIKEENEIENSDKPKSEKADIQTQRFNEFWSAYPNKKGKTAALKAWTRIKPTAALFERMMSKIAEAKNSREWKNENGKYIPHPATWLNQGRWDDEFEQNIEQKGKGESVSTQRKYEPSKGFNNFIDIDTDTSD